MIIYQCTNCGAKSYIEGNPERGKKYRCWKCSSLITSGDEFYRKFDIIDNDESSDKTVYPQN